MAIYISRKQVKLLWNRDALRAAIAYEKYSIHNSRLIDVDGDFGSTAGIRCIR
jgi:hypothetical protein